LQLEEINFVVNSKKDDINVSTGYKPTGKEKLDENVSDFVAGCCFSFFG
jgi:hypothetical protein